MVKDYSLEVMSAFITLAEDYIFGPEDLLPRGIGLITAGVNTHPSHVDIVVRGWSRELENWILDHVVIDGDPNTQAVLEQVDQVLSQTYLHLGSGIVTAEMVWLPVAT